MSDKAKVTLTIDGQEVLASPEATLMEVIGQIGEQTPAICYHEATSSEGLCRVCVVDVEGWGRLAPACITRVSQDMAVTTNNERVVRTRRTILEMLNATVDLSQAPEIQQHMDRYQVDRDRFPQAEAREFPLLDDNPFYVRDYSKCLLCWRCVQACGDDMQFTYALSVGGRGYESNIATFFEESIPDSACVFCGNCVAVCPTNALKDKTEYYLEQGLDWDSIRLEKKKARRRQKSDD